jgi:hypothetical protein
MNECNTGHKFLFGLIWIQVEVDLISKIQHPNLMPLLGYSCDGPQHLLVHGLMQNGSLHDQLHGKYNSTQSSV